MEEILETTLLDNENSTFLIDLVKHHSGEKYIRLTQTSHKSGECSVLKLNPDVISDIIGVIKFYFSKIPSDRKDATEKKEKEVIRRYENGVPLEELPVQFNCSLELIKSIISNHDIPIVDNRLPKKRRLRRGE